MICESAEPLTAHYRCQTCSIASEMSDILVKCNKTAVETSDWHDFILPCGGNGFEVHPLIVSPKSKLLGQFCSQDFNVCFSVMRRGPLQWFRNSFRQHQARNRTSTAREYRIQ